MTQWHEQKKTAVVFGAGFVGSRLCKRLEKRGWNIVKTFKTELERRNAQDFQEGMGLSFVVKVGDEGDVHRFAKRVKNLVKEGEVEKIHTVIYTAGNYSKGGASKEKSSRSKLPLVDLLDEINTQILGPDLVFRYMLSTLTDGGSFIFTSSLAHDNLQHNLVVPEQWEHTIRDMRKDLDVVSRGIRIHHLASGPTDTHYYNDENRPEKVLPVTKVIEKIISLINAGWNTSEKMNEPD